MKKGLLLFFSLISMVMFSGCTKWIDRGDSITAVGSSALQPLVETASEEYQAHHPGKLINVQGGGSGTGLSQVQSKAVEIGNSDLFAEEKQGIKANQLKDHKVAVVGITPIVNRRVGIKNISLSNLKKIFLGEITNWKEIGGNDQTIVIINRATGSGTRATFEKWVLNGKTAISAQEQDSSGMVSSIVADTPGAISYTAFSYVTKNVQTLNIDGVKPTDSNVMINKWTIWSYEHMYTYGEPKKLTRNFIQFILSDDVQNKLGKQLGYISISKMKVERDWQGNLITMSK
nr:phosphate ABC transporter substrate-binding protein PstS [Melissococcus plutonius]